MKREEPHCKAVRLFPLVEHRGFVSRVVEAMGVEPMSEKSSA